MQDQICASKKFLETREILACPKPKFKNILILWTCQVRN